MFGRHQLINPKRIAILTTAALTFIAISYGGAEANAEGIKHLDQIRVALVINATKYKKLEPLVSLTSAGGFDIGVRSFSELGGETMGFHFGYIHSNVIRSV